MSNTTTTQPSVKDLAAAAKPDRNRAIDFYRAAAMIAVALGHWLALDVALDAAGEIRAGNALESAPSMAWVSWLLQVMPLFFVVGGFSSAMSLDAFNRDGGGRPQDWVAARLRRMVGPAVLLGGVWALVALVGFGLGQGALVIVALPAAAIPLWFLANYSIDTALAPWVLPAFRRHPVLFPAIALSVFISIEGLRLLEVPIIPRINWVLGWLL
ncbi:MAG: acyltransferase family protein, partial [Acidimicrobiales bacterium]